MKNRRVLNSPLNKRVLEALQRIGVQEELLPPALQKESDSNRVYICKGCFNELEQFSKLQADVQSVGASIKAKLQSQGMTVPSV